MKDGASFEVTENVIKTRVLGFQGNADLDAWAPVLMFTASAEGAYALAGQLKLWFDGDPAEKDSIQWAVVTLSADSKFTVLAGEKTVMGTTVDLAKQEPLKKIQLKAGEGIGIIVWRPAWWHAVGMELTGLAVNKAS